MEFFDEFEIIGRVIPNHNGLAFFMGWLFTSIKLEKQKSDEEKKYLIKKKKFFLQKLK